MNYLSHFVVDHEPGAHYYNAGLILPDVCKKWIRSFRHPDPSPAFSHDQSELLRGALAHYRADKLFHSSDFFGHYSALFTHAINKCGLSERVQRKWFLAHIAFEVMLDRVIVKKVPALVDAFYESLSRTDDKVLAGFLGYYGMKETDDFFTFFNHFRSIRYIYYYTDNNKFIYSLNRIMMRVGLPEMGPADQEKLTGVLLKLENMYFADAESTITELKSVFNRV